MLKWSSLSSISNASRDVNLLKLSIYIGDIVKLTLSGLMLAGLTEWLAGFLLFSSLWMVSLDLGSSLKDS
jgi:hypothetical protein